MTKSVRMLWDEIVQWYVQNNATHNRDMLHAGAADTALQKLETALGRKLPRDLRTSLRLHDGGGDMLHNYEYLTTDGILKAWSRHSTRLADGGYLGWHPQPSGNRLQPVWWHRGWIPFAEDSAGNLMCIDLAPGPRGRAGQLVAFERQENVGPLWQQGTFRGWLRAFRDGLYDGLLVVNSEGFIEERPRPSLVLPVGSAPPSMPPDTGHTVRNAIDAGDLDALNALIAQHSINLNHLIFNKSMVAWAASQNHFHIVRDLITRGADPNLDSWRGQRTALHWAAWGMKASLENVRWLVEHGANVNALTAYDGTVLHAAVMWEQVEIVRYLLAQGADPSLADADGRTPLDHARAHKRPGAAIKAIIRALDTPDRA